MKLITTLGLAAGALAGTANAADILVTSDITGSVTWTANNTYNLQDQIYVRPGATLTIEAGTVVASTTNIGGSLAVTRGGQIFVEGTAANPVIMTSTDDVATWVGGDPKTGTWRPAANEWGNLTIMGNGYVSENATAGNTPTPSASNVAAMEGLVAAFPGDPDVIYGGGNDDDDSGSIQFLTLRYGGRVIGLNNELNGISLGGIGRGTDISYVEIMNNVDDGFEIWGGAVNVDHFSIWNVGDDSFDVDQGWRGKAQFGLIVQGYSLDASQGSGVGDNGFEMDGAEDSDWQPVTTTTLYNMTFIGQPLSGDGATAWRDNARVQYRNSIFMDCGEQVVRFDGDDGDGASGYGHNGTLTWNQTWNTPYTQTSSVNPPANPSAFYQAQSSGNLSEITDSVFFRNVNVAAYTEATSVGVFNASNNNVQVASTAAGDAPIQSITRGPLVSLFGGALQQLPVVSLDPRAANDALTSAGSAPADGFFKAAAYRGAFEANANWLCGWSASEAFGFIEAPQADVEVLAAPQNVDGSFTAVGNPVIGNAGFALSVSNTGGCDVDPGAAVFVYVSLGDSALPFPNIGCNGALGLVQVDLTSLLTSISITGALSAGSTTLPVPIPNNPLLCGLEVYLQSALINIPSFDVRVTNALKLTLGQ